MPNLPNQTELRVALSEKDAALLALGQAVLMMCLTNETLAQAVFDSHPNEDLRAIANHFFWRAAELEPDGDDRDERFGEALIRLEQYNILSFKAFVVFLEGVEKERLLREVASAP